MSTTHQSTNNQYQPSRKGLHPRNIHRQGYDFPALLKSYPPLAAYVSKNSHGNLSVDFADPLAVKALNASLLKHHYNIVEWDIPEGALCPPIPGRADYIHYVADLLGYDEQASSQPAISMLDIGTGANGIYPLLAGQIYGWRSVGSDINAQSLENVRAILASNPQLESRIEVRTQQDKNHFFEGIVQAGEHYDVSVCNPPFHASEGDALKSNQRKSSNLARNRGDQTGSSPSQNFGGLEAELWCKGGEQLFLKKLIKESQNFSDQCRWFTSLVSKVETLKSAKKLLRKLGATEIREIEMAQGNKNTRILAWRFIAASN